MRDLRPVEPKSNVRLLEIAAKAIKNGQESKTKFADWFQREPVQALEQSSGVFLEMARLEVGEWLHQVVTGAKEEQYVSVVSILTENIFRRSCDVVKHTSNETSNMLDRARLQAMSELHRRLTEYDF